MSRPTQSPESLYLGEEEVQGPARALAGEKPSEDVLAAKFFPATR